MISQDTIVSQLDVSMHKRLPRQPKEILLCEEEEEATSKISRPDEPLFSELISIWVRTI